MASSFKSSSVARWAPFLFLSLATCTPLSSVPTAAWQALNSSVDGRLGVGKPMAIPCYASYNDGSSTNLQVPDLGQCAAIQQNISSPFFVSDHFGGYITYNFEPCVATSQGCPISSLAPGTVVSALTGTCYQGSVPSYYVDARNVNDIQQSLAFATKWKLPLVVKNTGHDYRGRSNAPNSFAIWTHNFVPPAQLEQDFVPDGCSQGTGPSLTYGAGQQFQGLYDLAFDNGYMIIGGGSPSVGAAGGYITGGGHSFASVNYGLGVDNVMQMRVVLPNGTYVTANRCQNQDIFFAMRGGGGATFGVLAEMTTHLYPAVPMQMASITVVSLAPDAVRNVLQTLIENAIQWSDDGWGGYVGPDFVNGHALQVSLVTPKLTLQEAEESMKPLTDLLSNLEKLSVPVITNITTLPSGYQDFLNSEFVKLFNILDNASLAPSSRLVPKQFFNGSDSQQQLLDTLVEIADGFSPNPIIPYYVLFVPPSQFELPESDIAPYGPGAASVTPAWRDSLWHVFLEAIWDPSDPTASGAGSPTAAFEKAHTAVDPLRSLTPNSGAYQNEADPFEPNAPQSFWGLENYARLLEIKKAVDPENLLTCYNCVGWDPSDARYSCYPDI